MSGTSKKRARKDEVTTYDDCDAGSWECTVCTYRNRFEAFKCEMCDTSFKRRAHQSVGSPSTSRHSPESSSSGSAVRSLNTHGGVVKNRRRMVLVSDHLIYRTFPKKITVVVNGVPATITEFRRKPISSERVRRQHFEQHTPLPRTTSKS
ncbi:hypothetical protein Q1695_000474 [Nippostrongylus brasiliensis]|nr:hypothetical protein Q1695_000474 [Nippostrongylus brasiliensis]